MSAGDVPDRHHKLAREIRRGLFVWKQALLEWAEGEPNPTHALIASTFASVLKVIANALGAWNEDGRIVPGDAQRLPPPKHRPPVEFP